MLNNEQIKLLATFTLAWNDHPEWRFGQLVANAVRSSTGKINCDPFYIIDEDIETGLKETMNDAV